MPELADDLRELTRIANENRIRHELVQAELDRRFSSLNRELDQRFRAAEVAVNKAEVAAEKRFDSVNEFRQTLSDQTKSFVTEDKYEGLGRVVDDLRERLTAVESVARGASIAAAEQRSNQGLSLQGSDIQQNAAYYHATQVRAMISISIAAFSVLIAFAAILTTVVLHH